MPNTIHRMSHVAHMKYGVVDFPAVNRAMREIYVILLIYHEGLIKIRFKCNIQATVG